MGDKGGMRESRAPSPVMGVPRPRGSGWIVIGSRIGRGIVPAVNNGLPGAALGSESYPFRGRFVPGLDTVGKFSMSVCQYAVADLFLRRGAQ